MKRVLLILGILAVIGWFAFCLYEMAARSIPALGVQS